MGVQAGDWRPVTVDGDGLAVDAFRPAASGFVRPGSDRTFRYGPTEGIGDVAELPRSCGGLRVSAMTARFVSGRTVERRR